MRNLVASLSHFWVAYCKFQNCLFLLSVILWHLYISLLWLWLFGLSLPIIVNCLFLHILVWQRMLHTIIVNFKIVYLFQHSPLSIHTLSISGFDCVCRSLLCVAYCKIHKLPILIKISLLFIIQLYSSADWYFNLNCVFLRIIQSSHEKIVPIVNFKIAYLFQHSPPSIRTYLW